MEITPRLTNCIENGIPISFSKYGDGEYACASGEYSRASQDNISNCDRDTMTLKLQTKLRESFKYMVENVDNAYFGLWHDNSVIDFWKEFVTKEIKWVNYHTMIIDNDLNIKSDSFYAKMKLYKTIKNSKMKKIMVCNPLMIKAKTLLNIDDMIHVPLCNWFDTELETIVHKIKTIVTDEPFIVLTSCGMGSKVLICELVKLFPHGIFLDVGSGLDLLCTKKDSRGREYSYNTILKEFKNHDMIPDNWDDSSYDDIYKVASRSLGVHLPSQQFSADFLITHVKNSISNAFSNISNLSNDILSMEGMSGNKTRHLYNNICNLPHSTYLEVGTWKGSSFISAMYNNYDTYGYCVDNWCEFGGPKDDFYNNIKRFLTNKDIKVIDKDCWAITSDDLQKKINIFMYDGAHDYESQKKAITYYHQFFSKFVIIMVDDWTCDWVDVKRGTMDGIKEMNMIVHYSYEIPLINTTSHHQGGDTFWNGCGVFVCEVV
jgi:hypothetical protein